MSDFGHELEPPFFPDEELFMTRLCTHIDFVEESDEFINNKLSVVRDEVTDSSVRNQAAMDYVASHYSLQDYSKAEIRKILTETLDPELYLGVDAFVQTLPHIRTIRESKLLGGIPENTTEFTPIPVAAGMEPWALYMLVIASRVLVLPVSAAVGQNEIHVTPGMGVNDVMNSLRKAA